ncbi:SRPBCC family protein [Gordonia oryzae]|uniref:SRPBCC family protein n=1 Tax=Gordonia oryzae TaxID=2487349 RepID=A0A3N4GHB7_9ACTN|nr:SRPBCC family protein [Gordonia oryzae]RPA58511.1 SRPBCC family protein [Gordonia oryzae]
MKSTARLQIADVTVHFDVASEVAFDYLSDPGRRAEWQASLLRVTDEADVGEPGATGSSWIDITAVPFVRPAMEVVESRRAQRWREIGRWGPVDAALTLDFEAQGKYSTLVRARAHLTVPMLAAPGLLGVRVLAPAALAADLRTAARLLRDSQITDHRQDA